MRERSRNFLLYSSLIVILSELLILLPSFTTTNTTLPSISNVYYNTALAFKPTNKNPSILRPPISVNHSPVS